MKVLLIDISYNSSYEKVTRFLQSHKNAELVYIFDYEYAAYFSSQEVLDELHESQNDYFTHPCAYHDLLIKLLGKLRRTGRQYDVFICSEGIDDCSIYSSLESFENYIYHLQVTSGINVNDASALLWNESDYNSIIESDSFISRIHNKFLPFFSFLKFYEYVDD